MLTKQEENIYVPAHAQPHGYECAHPHKILATQVQTEAAVDGMNSFLAPRKSPFLSLKGKHHWVYLYTAFPAAYAWNSMWHWTFGSILVWKQQQQPFTETNLNPLCYGSWLAVLVLILWPGDLLCSLSDVSQLRMTNLMTILQTEWFKTDIIGEKNPRTQSCHRWLINMSWTVEIDSLSVTWNNPEAFSGG